MLNLKKFKLIKKSKNKINYSCKLVILIVKKQNI